jgi:hypothetical protein
VKSHDMAKKAITLQLFEGGLTPQEKRGIAGSARFIKNLNPHEDDSYLIPSVKAAKVSGSTVTGLVKWAVDGSPWNDNRYFYDSDGNIYKETSEGVWSVQRSGATIGDSAAGQGLTVFDNALFYATSTKIGRLNFRSNAHADSFLYTDYDQSDGTGTSDTYTVQTTISEAATHKRAFTPEVDPVAAIEVFIETKGTGDWTLTVHDSLNNVMVEKTLANGSIFGNEWETFRFDTPMRITINDPEYHFHLTSTVADGTVIVATSSDFSTANYATKYNALIDTEYHPMTEFLNFMVIGNERYLAYWDVISYNPNQLTFGPQYKVRSLTKIDEYLVIGCWRGSDIDDEDLGRLYFWDGISPTFNFFKDVPMGVVNALTSSKNRLLGVYGSSGKIYLGIEEFMQIGKVPKLGRGKKIEVLPGAITNWQGLTAIGMGANTDDATGVEQGVYLFGSQDNSHPEVITLAHTISTGTTQGTSLEIGCVEAFGADMYIGWKDDTTYGVDKVSKTGDPSTSGVWESLIFDKGNPKKEGLAEKVIVTFEPLKDGESITPKYKIDRAASFTDGTEIDTVGETSAEILLDARFKEFEWGFEVATGTTFPKITSTTLLWDDLAEERNE